MTPDQEVNLLRSQVLELSDRLDALETVRDQEIEQIPSLEDDPGVPRVGNLGLLSFSGTEQLDEVVIGFEEPRDHPAATNVEAYELYTKGTTSLAQDFVKVAEATRSPFVMPITSNVTGVLTAVVRTRMKGGLGTPVDTSPSMTIDITALSNEIAAGSIGTTELADGAVTTQKIANLAVTNAKIGDAEISTAKIQNAAITNALIANATIDQAKINSVAAGTIQAGTINSVNINAGTYTLTSGLNQMLINGTNGFFQQNTGTGLSVQLINGSLQQRNSFGNLTVFISSQSNEGAVDVRNNAGSVRGSLTSLFSSGVLQLTNIFNVSNAFLYSDGSQLGFASNRGALSLRTSAGTERLGLGIDSSNNGTIRINGSDGVSGSFTAGSGETITVTRGIITSIV